MTSKIIISVFSLLILISCNKNDKITLLEGNVMDFYSKNIMPNVVLHIAFRDPTNPHYQPTTYSQSTWVENIQVSSNGHFSLKTKALSNHKYDLILINDSIISSVTYQVIPYTDNIYTFLTKKLKNITLHIINQDSIYNKATFDISNDPFSKSFILNGTSNDTVLFEKVIPDKLYLIKCTLQKPNNKDTVITNSLVIGNNDTITSYILTY